MRQKFKLVTGLIVLVLILGVAIFFVVSGNRSPELVVRQTETIGDDVSVTEVPAAEIQKSAEPTRDDIVEELTVPTPRAGLESTNPASVNLASGDIQLVEAFAFW